MSGVVVPKPAVCVLVCVGGKWRRGTVQIIHWSPSSKFSPKEVLTRILAELLEFMCRNGSKQVC